MSQYLLKINVCLHFAYFNFLDKERGRAFHLLTSPRESRAGVKGSSPLPRPETLQHVEDMAKKLLISDEVAAVMRHCQRVSSDFETTSSNTSVALSCLCLFFLPNRSHPGCLQAPVFTAVPCVLFSDRCVC